jgi:hypothetical protein
MAQAGDKSADFPVVCGAIAGLALIRSQAREATAMAASTASQLKPSCPGCVPVLSGGIVGSVPPRPGCVPVRPAC